MISKRTLLGLIMITTAIFLFAAAASQAVVLMVPVFVAGLAWFVLEKSEQQTASTLFFLFFAGLAVWGSLNGHSPVVMLLGLCTTLAAWDLSRFRARAGYGEVDPILESRHLRRLFPIIGIGFVVALPPLFFEISPDFVAFFFLTLLAMIMLRASALNLLQ